MTSSTRLRIAALAGAATLSLAALAGCGDSSSTSTTGTTGAGTSTASSAATAEGDGTLTTVTLANGAEEDVTVYSSESGTVVNETLGRTFAVSLPQSPSTGYEWKATGGTAAGALVQLKGDTVQTESDAPGSPGTHLFVYTASGEGQGTLVFEEFPPGETTAAKTVTFEVSVGTP
jgi:predicted secreted protein